jgi:hypothetical protein
MRKVSTNAASYFFFCLIPTWHGGCSTVQRLPVAGGSQLASYPGETTVKSIIFKYFYNSVKMLK